MKKTATYLTLILFILLSCAKDGKRIFVEGKVLNPITGEGIEGIRVKIMKNALSGGYKVLKETYTDADGNYELGVNSVAIDVYVRCDGDFGLHIIGWDLNFETEFVDIVTFRIPKKGRVYNADYHTVPEGGLKKSIINTSCFNDNDEIKIFAQDEVVSINQSAGPLMQTGCVSMLYGNDEFDNPSGKIFYHYFVTKNNITTEHFDTLYVYPKQENIHVIEY